LDERGEIRMLTQSRKHQLSPFVTETMPRTYGDYDGIKLGPKDPATYLARWKAENGLD
jgi:large subunit ribosomal protein L41